MFYHASLISVDTRSAANTASITPSEIMSLWLVLIILSGHHAPVVTFHGMKPDPKIHIDLVVLIPLSTSSMSNLHKISCWTRIVSNNVTSTSCEKHYILLRETLYSLLGTLFSLQLGPCVSLNVIHNIFVFAYYILSDRSSVAEVFSNASLLTITCKDESTYRDETANHFLCTSFIFTTIFILQLTKFFFTSPSGMDMDKY